MRDFGCKSADRFRRDAGPARNIGGRVFFAEITLGQNMEDGLRDPTVRERVLTLHRRRHIGTQRARLGVRLLIPTQRIAVTVAREHTIVGTAWVLDHQPWSIGVAHKIRQIDFSGL